LSKYEKHNATNVLGRPTLFFGHKLWTETRPDERRLIQAKKKIFVVRTAGYSFLG
jgi:hypothetical protein